MGLQDKFVIENAAPAAHESIPRFDEVDRPLIFRSPDALLEFVPGFIDLDKGTRHDQGIHGEILHTNVPIRMVAGEQLRKVAQWDQAPLLNHPPQIHCLLRVEARIKRQRHLHHGRILQGAGDVRAGRFRQVQIGRCIVCVNSKPGQQLFYIAAVDNAQGVKAVETRSDTLGLDVGKAAKRDTEIIVLMPGGNANACTLDIPYRKSELLT